MDERLQLSMSKADGDGKVATLEIVKTEGRKCENPRFYTLVKYRWRMPVLQIFERLKSHAPKEVLRFLDQLF